LTSSVLLATPTAWGVVSGVQLLVPLSFAFGFLRADDHRAAFTQLAIVAAGGWFFAAVDADFHPGLFALAQVPLTALSVRLFVSDRRRDRDRAPR